MKSELLTKLHEKGMPEAVDCFTYEVRLRKHAYELIQTDAAIAMGKLCADKSDIQGFIRQDAILSLVSELEGNK